MEKGCAVWIKFSVDQHPATWQPAIIDKTVRPHLLLMRTCYSNPYVVPSLSMARRWSSHSALSQRLRCTSSGQPLPLCDHPLPSYHQ